jgi:hypothetical protein
VEKLNAADVGRLSPGVSPAKKAKLETAEASSEPTMSKVWSKLAQWFLRRRIKCEKLTTDDGRRTKPDDKS